jgi:hydroxymethylglutaryl-CoA lyase
MLEEVRKIVSSLHSLPSGIRPSIEVSISTAFGCTYEGNISPDKVEQISETLIETGVDEIGLADSAGTANPTQIKSVVTRVRAAIGKAACAGLHLHNNRGLGLANVLAGLEVGVTTFDSSLAGLGGCPFLPGAAGNIVTEDLVFMLEAMGIKTGINLEALLNVRKILEDSLPGETLYGFTPNAGLPLGFQSTNIPEPSSANVN